jgi:hypothetical protein
MTKAPVDPFKLMARQRLAQRSHAALMKAFWSVRPIFWPDERGAAELVGSSVLFAVDHRYFIITAAHVLDRVAERTLYIGGRDLLHEIEGHRKTTEAPGGNREADKIDLAFLEIGDPLAGKLEGCHFLTPADIDVDEAAVREPVGSSHYLAIGYPATKVKVKRSESKVVPEPLASSGRSLDDPSYAKLGVAEYSHVLIEFDRKQMIGHDGPRTAPDPHGMSGGALFRFNSLLGSAEATDHLVGILIEYHRNMVKGMLATRISLCMEAMCAFYPDLAGSLPRTRRVRVKSVHR